MKTRTRKPKPQPAALGTLSLSQWQSDADRIQWAQQNLSLVYTVLVNERSRALTTLPGETENCRLGKALGYDLACQVIADLGRGQEVSPLSEVPPSYPAENDRTGVHDI